MRLASGLRLIVWSSDGRCLQPTYWTHSRPWVNKPALLSESWLSLWVPFHRTGKTLYFQCHSPTYLPWSSILCCCHVLSKPKFLTVSNMWNNMLKKNVKMRYLLLAEQKYCEWAYFQTVWCFNCSQYQWRESMSVYNIVLCKQEQEQANTD